MMKRIAFALVLCVPTLASAQPPNFGGEQKTSSLTHRGIRANAQTRIEDHTRNLNPNVPGWGGCVPSSVRTAALHAGIPRDRIDHFWEIAQRRVGVGGTDPQLLSSMLYEAYGKDEPWTSFVGSDPGEVRRVYDALSAKGYLVCSTMGWGELYKNQRIAHMVSDPHFDSKRNLACVEDNNDPPGVFRWMPATERLKRSLGGGQAWLFAFTREHPAAVQGAAAAAVLIVAAALFFFASSLLLAGRAVSEFD